MEVSCSEPESFSLYRASEYGLAEELSARLLEQQYGLRKLPNQKLGCSDPRKGNLLGEIESWAISPLEKAVTMGKG